MDTSEAAQREMRRSSMVRAIVPYKSQHCTSCALELFLLFRIFSAPIIRSVLVDSFHFGLVDSFHSILVNSFILD